MKKNIINRLSIMLVMVLPVILALSAFGEDFGAGIYREGYGAYGTMGQDPDEILKYGHEMMRYGFRESGMSGGPSSYPGYSGQLGDGTIKELNAEQEAFILGTETLRQTIYEKELYLKAELVKKEPDAVTALNFQKNISDAKGRFEQKMIEHLIRMKKNKFRL